MKKSESRKWRHIKKRSDPSKKNEITLGGQVLSTKDLSQEIISYNLTKQGKKSETNTIPVEKLIILYEMRAGLEATILKDDCSDKHPVRTVNTATGNFRAL